MSDTSLTFNLIAKDRASAVMDRMSDRFTAASTAIGTGVGMALGVGVAASLDMEASNAKLAAQLGLNEAEAERIGTVSGNVFSSGFGQSIGEVNTALGGIVSAMGEVGDFTDAELQSMTAGAMTLADTFEIDVAESAMAAGQLIKTGLAVSGQEAFDILTAGAKALPQAMRADLPSILNEYSTQFRRVGLDGQTAMALLAQGVQGGARDIDQVADAIGQFGELALAGGTAATDAFRNIGLNADTMALKIGAGGDSAEQALQMTLDALRGTKDEQIKLNAATALFGDPGTVMGDALFALDPAGAAAATGLDKAAGSTQGLVDKTSGTAAAKLQEFKNKALTHLAEVGGGFAKFAMDNQGIVVPLAYALTGLAGVVMAVSAAQKVYAAYTAISTAATNIQKSATYKAIAGWMRMMAVGLMAYIRIAAGAVASAAMTAAAWVGSALVSIGTWIAAVVRASLTAVAQFAMMAARAIVWAATMAAQWLIAMGPIGWIIMAVVALVVLVIAYWDEIKAWTLAAWDWVWNKIKQVADFILQLFLNFTLVGLIIKHWDTIRTKTAEIWDGIVDWVKGIPGKIYNAFLNFTPIGLMIKHWDSIKRWVIIKAIEMVAWLRGLPGRIGNAIGNLGRLLVNKGRDLVTGLWNGIKSMGAWLKSTLIGWAKNLIPGPIAEALGISSPSKYMAKHIGRWIPAGVVLGIESGQADVDRSMANLVQAPGAGASMLAGQQLAGGGMSPSVRPTFTPSVVRVVLDTNGADGEMTKLLRKIVRVQGRGNVQTAFGQ
ncbi:hypothetical protein [Streptomyces sp. NPDC059909]|uniref:hypothetical protein n=1 Tax=Streptomyces sp. NPDC059909 TaxID=3346998 RepID=UPI003652D014